MTSTTILGSTPIGTPSLSQQWEERECSALLTQLVSLVGAAPATVQFHLLRFYDVEVDLSFLALSSVAEATIPKRANKTVLAISHRLNENEGVDYVMAVESAYDSTKGWSSLALRQLGPSYKRTQ